MTEPLLRALTARAVQARSCYQELLRESPKAEARLLVELGITEAGEVAEAFPVEDEMQDARLSACVLSYLSAARLPAPAGGCAAVRIPLRFVPKKIDGASGEAP